MVVHVVIEPAFDTGLIGPGFLTELAEGYLDLGEVVLDSLREPIPCVDRLFVRGLRIPVSGMHLNHKVNEATKGDEESPDYPRDELVVVVPRQVGESHWD